MLKSSLEVELLQRVNDLASDAHLAAMAHAKPGMFEFQVEATFLHHCYYRGGARMAAYTSEFSPNKPSSCNLRVPWLPTTTLPDRHLRLRPEQRDAPLRPLGRA